VFLILWFQAGLARVVIGMRSPMAQHWGRAVRALSEAGIAVDILGEGPLTDSASEVCHPLSPPALSSAHSVPGYKHGG